MNLEQKTNADTCNIFSQVRCKMKLIHISSNIVDGVSYCSYIYLKTRVSFISASMWYKT
jgi:hypothetical protein